jgi:hypothetical protein
VNEVVLSQRNVDSLLDRAVESFNFRIGGTSEKRAVYDLDFICDHFDKGERSTADLSQCIEDEYCEKDHLLLRDKQTISTGFNIYQVLLLLLRTHPEHSSLSSLQKDMRKQNRLWQQYSLYYACISKTNPESE